MSYALSYDSPGALPIGILGIYFLLTLVKWLIKNAQIFWPQRPQQTDLAIQENTPSIEGISKRDPSEDRVFRSNRTTSPKAEITDNSRDSRQNSDHGTIHQHATDSHSTGQDTSSKTDFQSSLSQSCDGSIPNKSAECPTNRGTSDDSEGIHKSSQIGKNTQGTKLCCDQGISDQAACPANKSNCAELQTPQADNTTRHQTTQIYLKTKEIATYSPWVKDDEEAEQVIYDFVQTIVQQTQRHMQKQIEQCVQQTYSGIGHTGACQRAH